jgi:hypothetical protein
VNNSFPLFFSNSIFFDRIKRFLYGLSFKRFHLLLFGYHLPLNINSQWNFFFSLINYIYKRKMNEKNFRLKNGIRLRMNEKKDNHELFIMFSKLEILKRGTDKRNLHN